MSHLDPIQIARAIPLVSEAQTADTERTRKLENYQRSVEANAKAKTIWKAVQIPLENLYGRWQDEKEYEDIKDYGEAIRPTLEAAGGELTRMSARPFGAYFVVDSYTYLASVTLRGYHIKGLGKVK